jgi:dTDP-4-amino-4,6-dideoxygalactose transaminase
MKFGNNFKYCGPHGFSCSLFFGTPINKCIDSLFENVETYYVHKARTGIRRALELLNFCEGDEVLVPSYNCGSEVDALIHNGTNVVPYRVDRDCNIDIADLISRITPKIKAIYVIHYFGFPQDIESIKNICDKYTLYLIEDCALSLFSKDNIGMLGIHGDISIYNFPKSLPVPDGGLLSINNINLKLKKWELSSPKYFVYLNNTIKLINSMLFRKYVPSMIVKYMYYLRHIFKKINNRRELLYNRYPGIPENYYYNDDDNNKSVSDLSKHVLDRIDYTYVINKRRENYLLYQKLLLDVDSIKPIFKNLPENVCPLYYPIIIQNRDNICYELNKVSISSISWWSGYHPALDWDKFPDASYLKNYTLVLPVHQDLNNTHIMYIVDKLKNIIKSMRVPLDSTNNFNFISNSEGNP